MIVPGLALLVVLAVSTTLAVAPAPSVFRAPAAGLPAPPGALRLHTAAPNPAVSLAVYRAAEADPAASAARYGAVLASAGYAVVPAAGPPGASAYLVRRRADLALVLARPGAGGAGALITIAESRAPGGTGQPEVGKGSQP